MCSQTWEDEILANYCSTVNTLYSSANNCFSCCSHSADWPLCLKPITGLVWQRCFILCVSTAVILERATHSNGKDLPCERLLLTPQRYYHLLQCDLSCATSGSTWDLFQRGSWPWNAPDHTLQSPALYRKAALSAWIGPVETWRETRCGEKS